MSRTIGLRRPLAFGFLGAVLGIAIGQLADFPATSAPEILPYPHVVPKSPGGVSLRFAMVHDVIHERFPRHGAAYYKERNRRTRAALDELKAKSPPEQPSPREDELLNDLGVGLEMAGDHDAAVQLMRDKLKQQLAANRPLPELYSTHANLGTFLILGPFRQVRPGNEDDKATLREGLKQIETAIEINPDSHFGREVWQTAIIKYMIALYDDPNVLLKFDMVGNDLAADVSGVSPMSDFGNRPGASGPLRWGTTYGGVKMARDAAAYLRRPDEWEKYRGARRAIPKLKVADKSLGASWEKTAEPDILPANAFGTPFDEPTLGIIGMWRLGGGAHPYFAIALGETMLRVGQNYLAWSAFERAARIANGAWPDANLQRQFAEHCRRRQAAIEAKIAPEEIGKLRPAFDAELALGQDYQRAYQQYEEERIAAGASLDDPQFYSSFEAQRGPIATPVGDADWFWIGGGARQAAVSTVELSLLLAGLFALGGVALRPS